MLFDRLKINQRSDAGWVYLEDGLQYTSNLTVIAEEVRRLIKEKTWVELRGPGGYRSTPTFVVNFENGTMEIDRPSGWPNLHRAAIVYRRECQPWHFLDLTPCGSSDKGVFFNTPRLFVIYEKRESYRVTAPLRSKVIVYKEMDNEVKKKKKKQALERGDKGYQRYRCLFLPAHCNCTFSIAPFADRSGGFGPVGQFNGKVADFRDTGG